MLSFLFNELAGFPEIVSRDDTNVAKKKGKSFRICKVFLNYYGKHVFYNHHSFIELSPICKYKPI